MSECLKYTIIFTIQGCHFILLFIEQESNNLPLCQANKIENVFPINIIQTI